MISQTREGIIPRGYRNSWLKLRSTSSYTDSTWETKYHREEGSWSTVFGSLAAILASFTHLLSNSGWVNQAGPMRETLTMRRPGEVIQVQHQLVPWRHRDDTLVKFPMSQLNDPKLGLYFHRRKPSYWREIFRACRLYICNLVSIHRMWKRVGGSKRYSEIDRANSLTVGPGSHHSHHKEREWDHI